MKKETDAYGDTSRLFLKECLFFVAIPIEKSNSKRHKSSPFLPAQYTVSFN